MTNYYLCWTTKDSSKKKSPCLTKQQAMSALQQSLAANPQIDYWIEKLENGNLTKLNTKQLIKSGKIKPGSFGLRRGQSKPLLPFRFNI